jgi:hypothetical protein
VDVVRERQVLTRARGCGARLSRWGEGLEAGERRDGEGWDGMKRKAPAGQHLPQESWPGPCRLRVGLVCSHWCQGHAYRHADAGCGLAVVRAPLVQRLSVLAGIAAQRAVLGLRALAVSPRRRRPSRCHRQPPAALGPPAPVAAVHMHALGGLSRGRRIIKQRLSR